eukprot:1869713-Rhodomonas_salina.1
METHSRTVTFVCISRLLPLDINAAPPWELEAAVVVVQPRSVTPSDKTAELASSLRHPPLVALLLSRNCTPPWATTDEAEAYTAPPSRPAAQSRTVTSVCISMLLELDRYAPPPWEEVVPCAVQPRSVMPCDKTAVLASSLRHPPYLTTLLFTNDTSSCATRADWLRKTAPPS